MWQVAVLYAVVLLSATLGDDQPCFSDAPDNCNFVGDLSSCRWTFDDTVWTYGSSSAVFGTDSSSGANMTSRTACSTGEETHCLQIHYLFEVENTSIRVLLIRVSDEDDGDISEVQRGIHSREQVIVWNSSDSEIRVCHTANIPIQSNDNFTIVLEARKFTAEIGNIFIHFINYIKVPCSTLPTSTAPSQLTNIQKERTTTIGPHVSADASNDVGVVVGVVVAVIVIAVAVVFFILYRRKQLHLWKTCFINKNEKNPTATSHSGGERSVGKYDKRAVNGVKVTPTVSGHNNHAFPASESQPSDTYYSVIKDTDESGAPHYSTIQECQSADGKTLADASKLTDDDPYEIKTENGHLTSRSTATRHANAYANLKGKTGGKGNPLAHASNGDNRHTPVDYSLARGTGDEVTGVHHCLEEDSNNHGEGGDTGLYHYAKDPDMNPEAGADAKGVYHILEEDPAISRDDQSLGVYHEPKVEQTGQRTAKVSKGLPGNYNTLDFVGKRSDLKTHEDGSGGVYNHLGAESDDPYNEVDRDVRLEVIDGEYSHIKLSDC
ncbi:hypothetical protein V1264_000818 [Littorina saxatilis]|uniref:MAM domain-containing protein n=1 Tax=Littorina saxatilis TaxID=31220 RepID=A0AAN9GN63_9CAEN